MRDGLVRRRFVVDHDAVGIEDGAVPVEQDNGDAVIPRPLQVGHVGYRGRRNDDALDLLVKQDSDRGAFDVEAVITVGQDRFVPLLARHVARMLALAPAKEGVA